MINHKFSFLTMLIILVGCASPINQTPTEPPITITTSIYSSSPSPTNTPVPPIDGILFLDMDANTRKGTASFNIDLQRLNSPVNQLVRQYLAARPDDYFNPDQVAELKSQIEQLVADQPSTLRDEMHPALLFALDTYLTAHPDVVDGSLVTIDEPALANYIVCIAADCVLTDSEGKFSVPSASSSARVNVNDPFIEIPAFAVRYFNISNGAVTVPAYTKDIDKITMSRLTSIANCNTDLIALVCKVDDDTLQVREQHLTDTEIAPITAAYTIRSGEANEIAVMQGFLTRPFVVNTSAPEKIWNYFDIRGTVLWVGDGFQNNYEGKTNQGNPFSSPFISGTNDGHQGIDYVLSLGTPVISAVSGCVIRINESNGINMLLTNLSDTFRTEYSHIDSHLVIEGQLSPDLIPPTVCVYRGQLIALSSDTGDPGSYYYGRPIPQLHFGVYRVVSDGSSSGDPSIDPYRNMTNIIATISSSFSLWSIDNLPVNPNIP